MTDKEMPDRGMMRENRGIPLQQRAQSKEIRMGHKWNCLIGLACTIHHPDGENCTTDTMLCTCGVGRADRPT